MIEILAIAVAIVFGIFFGIYYIWKKLIGGALQTALIEFFNTWHEKESFAEVDKDIEPSQRRRISEDMKEIAELAKAPANQGQPANQVQQTRTPQQAQMPEPRFEGVPQASLPDAAYDGQTYNQPLVAPSDIHQAQLNQQATQPQEQLHQPDVNAQLQGSRHVPTQPPQPPEPEHLTQNQVNADLQPSNQREMLPKNPQQPANPQANPNNDLQPLVEDNTFSMDDPVISAEAIDPETPSAETLDTHIPKGNRFPYGVRTSTTDSPNRRIRDKRYERNAAD